MRHMRNGKRIRKYDNVWTFGKPNQKTYCLIGNESVHRIVAFAFHGEPPSPQHIVDHIDTNHQNNRPENLRWVTKLENTLNNETTRAKVILICGSVEAFLKNPSLLWGHESMDSNFTWMRAVSPDEARISLERISQWARERPNPRGGSVGEWIFQGSRIKQKQSVGVSKHSNINSERSERAKEVIRISQFDRKPGVKVSNESESLTPNVIQIKWRTPTEFPLCPQEHLDNPLREYQARLTKNSIFCHNQYNDSLVFDTALVDNDTSLYVLCKSSDEKAVKPWSLVRVSHKDGIYYHESISTFFREDGAKKSFTIAQGKKWSGGEVFDDCC